MKIADFGVASLRRATLSDDAAAHATTVTIGEPPSPELTRPGTLLGTPLYMAPELATGAKDAEPSSDLYSFGVLAYELCSGERPLSDRDLLARLEGEPTRGPEPLGSRCAALDAGLAELADRCLTLDPSRRPSAREISATIKRAAPR